MFVRIRWHERNKVSFAYQQTASLVNIKLKWVKDRALDAVVAQEKDLRPVCLLVSTIYSAPSHCLPIYHLSRQRRQLGLPEDLKLSALIRRYPTLFHEIPVNVKGGSIPWFQLTNEALRLHQEEFDIFQKNETDLVQRLQKLLMLTRERILPLQTVEQLKWDMGLPYDYQHSLIPRYSQLFSFVRLPDDRIGLKLIYWDECLAISQLQKNALASIYGKSDQQLAFPVGFTRGFGLKRKCMKWLEEWQRLPYTSPYTDASHLDSRTDVFEKRIVGVFHELLNLMIQRKTEHRNMSNLRKPLGLPQKFTKVFGRHPGIFYISQKCSTQTVILREAYDRQELLNKHPLVAIRESYATLMNIGFLNRSRGLYKKSTPEDQEDDDHQNIISDYELSTAEDQEEEDYRS
ncbi:hypothetical protein IFM89_010187 [Coptis chinensis]|uniref:PORR domain-containing protein n=1 Tax=Coptis chinensis TaxID=261450 RepID=A0A835LAR0_9MAGN|nr:hypothetical protein IFM89_010187 [Coptis chinensis]